MNHLVRFFGGQSVFKKKVLHIFVDIFLLSLCGILLLGSALQARIFHSDLQRILSAPEFTVALRNTTSETQIQALLQALLQLPQVRNVGRDTKEAVYERMRFLHPGVTNYLEDSFIGNPFMEKVTIELRSLSDVSAIIAFLSRPELAGVLADETIPSMHEMQDAHIAAYHSSFLKRSLFGALSALGVIAFGLVLLFALPRVLRRHLNVLGTAYCAGAQRFHLFRLLLPDVCGSLLIAFACSILTIAVVLTALPSLTLSLFFFLQTILISLVAVVALGCAVLLLALQRRTVSTLLIERGYLS